MVSRLKPAVPMVVSIGVLAFAATWFVLNFTFHWVTVQDGVFGKFGLPEGFHLVIPAVFVAWGVYFMLGANRAALGKTMIAAITGSVCAAIVMVLGPATADAPDFWGLALWVGITAAALVILSTAVADDRFAPAPAFCCYASVLFWWIATGLDNFVPDGKGPGTVAAVTHAITDKPLAAGTGAFGGLISMSWSWVVVSVFASLVLGGLVGALSVRLAGVLGTLGASRSSKTDKPKMAVSA
jgi:hypothetical protein